MLWVCCGLPARCKIIYFYFLLSTYLQFSDYTLPLCCWVKRKEVIWVVFKVAWTSCGQSESFNHQRVASVGRSVREGVKWSTWVARWVSKPKKGFNDFSPPVTGHADGSVRFWDTTGTAMQQLHRLRTQKLFEKNKVRIGYKLKRVIFHQYLRPAEVTHWRKTRTPSPISHSARIAEPWQWLARLPKYFFTGCSSPFWTCLFTSPYQWYQVSQERLPIWDPLPWDPNHLRGFPRPPGRWVSALWVPTETPPGKTIRRPLSSRQNDDLRAFQGVASQHSSYTDPGEGFNFEKRTLEYFTPLKVFPLKSIFFSAPWKYFDSFN